MEGHKCVVVNSFVRPIYNVTESSNFMFLENRPLVSPFRVIPASSPTPSADNWIHMFCLIASDGSKRAESIVLFLS